MPTNEEKARVFAMYLGCKAYDLYAERESVLTGVLSTNVALEYRGLSFSRNYNEAQLILTPLEDITDEDAVEVANIIRPGKWKVKRHAQYIKYIDVIHDEYEYISINIFFLTGKVTPYFDDKPTGQCTLDAHDFLRSRSYALPYKSKCLFESGIAIKEGFNQKKIEK